MKIIAYLCGINLKFFVLRMATIKREISQKAGTDHLSEVFLLVSISIKRVRVKSRVRIPAHRFKPDGSITMLKTPSPEKFLLDNARARLEEIERDILAYCTANPAKSNRETLQALIDGDDGTTDAAPTDGTNAEAPTEIVADGVSFENAYNQFMHAHQTDPEETFLTEGTLKTYRVLKGIVGRFQAYERERGYKDYVATIESLTGDRRVDFVRFMQNETTAAKAFPQIYESAPSDNAVYQKEYKPKPRSNNTVATLTKKLNAIVNWCNDKELTNCRCVKCERETYAPPQSITRDERDAIMHHDFGKRWSLAIQRDIFIFQSYIGCRVSDLMRMTTDNVVMEDGEETIRYIAGKTIKHTKAVLSIPLHPVALTILHNYDKWRKENETTRLFPFIKSQKYNEYLKDIFRESGIDRVVTDMDPDTNMPVNTPLWKSASSHLARKTFISIMANAGVDQSVIKSMSGHKESNNNRAFARYFDITHAIKRAAIDKL